MFRRPLVKPSPILTSHSAFHTSTLCHSQVSRQKLARVIRKANDVKKEERIAEMQQNRPSVVLGTRPGDEVKWKNSLLAQAMVDTDELVSNTELSRTERPVGPVYMPKYVNFGIHEAEDKLLFDDLPLLSSDTPVQSPPKPEQTSTGQTQSDRPTVEVLKSKAEDSARRQMKALMQANVFAKIIDLRNANAGGIACENRRRIIEAFSTPENPFDTGRSEVQAALLTYKIRNLWSHLTKYKKDLGSRRSLRKLVHQRAKILKYLKGVDQNRYETILRQLALEPESIEGELVV